MEQGSSVWEKWRDEGLGSSDAPVIMEAEGAYKTRFKLYQEKLKLLPPPTEKELKAKEFIFAKGHHIEEMIRGRYELKENMSYSPSLFQREDFPYMKASFDLANMELRRGKEVKYVSLEEFEAGVVPARYYPQVQWQYLVSDFLQIDVVLCTDYMWADDAKTQKVKIPKSESIRSKEISCPIDMPYCVKLFEEGKKFWEEHILKKVPPALTDKDAVAVKDKQLKHLLKKYAGNKKKIDKVKQFEDDNEKLKEEIFKLATHPIMTYGKIRTVISEKKGTIDYKKIPAVAQMPAEDLEKYRGKSSFSKAIKC